jgi:hypothetical protein
MRARLVAQVAATTMMARCAVAAAPFVEVPFDFHEGLIWVQVEVARSPKPLDCLLDTGAAVSVLDIQVARRLRVRLGERVGVRGVGGQVDGFWPQRVSARIQDVKSPSEWLAVDLNCLSKACDRRVEGLLGADFFKGRIVQLDFASKKLRLLPASVPSETGEVLPIKLCRGAMRVPIRVNGSAPQWVRLDTGCASALQWVSPLVCTNGGESRLAIGLARLDIPGMNASVQLGKRYFESVPIGLHQEAIFRGETGLLGNGILSRFRVTIDAVMGRLILEGEDCGTRVE